MILARSLRFGGRSKPISISVAEVQHVSRGTTSKYSTETPVHYDMIVAGGGLVGNAMACAAGTSKSFSNQRILVLEGGKGYQPDKRITSDSAYRNRVSSVSPGSIKLFKNVGVWENIKNVRAKFVRQLQVWDSCSESRIHYEQADPSDPMSYIVENDVMVQCLAEKLINSCSENVEIRTETKIANYLLPKNLSEPVYINLENGNILSCDLLIGADGPMSQVRGSMDVKQVSWPYDQKGVVATLQLHQKWENDVSWQRFMPNGPIALLPLTEDLISLVWTTTNAEADFLSQCDDTEFVDRLNHALRSDSHQSALTNYALLFGSRVMDTLLGAKVGGKVPPPLMGKVQEGSRASFPLSLGHSTKYVGPRVALIGDAAHRIHPLAGLGVNLGFGDVTSLFSCLNEAVTRGADLGSELHLKQYEQERLWKNVPVMATCDGLNRLYSTALPPFVLMRSLGLDLINRIHPLKNLIISEASK